MFKRFATVVLAVLITSAVCAAAVKIKDFYFISLDEPDDADAMATLNYVKGQDHTLVHVILHGFTPDRYGDDAYDVILVSPSLGSASNGNVLETDEHGHGHIKLEISAPWYDVNDWTDSTVYVGFGLNYNGTAVTGDVRAEGAP